MTIEHGLFWIAFLVFGWACLRKVRSVRKKDRAWAAIADCHDLKSRGCWQAKVALRNAYNACYDAGMIEQYQNLHEWFEGRAESPVKRGRK